MADIFISYAKADRDLGSRLSTILEAEGWTVWWDKSLMSGDPYRDDGLNEVSKLHLDQYVVSPKAIN
jgi:hypothetical protein